MLNKVKIVILAAGQGTRMKSELPKVLAPLLGKPMVKHLLESVEKSGIDPKPIVVVGYQKEVVKDVLGNKYEYITQEEQLGTGHAIMATEKELRNNADHIMVFYGDHPFLKPETIKNLLNKHLASEAILTMGIVKVPDFDDWRHFFYTDSRIIRNKNGEIVKDVQFRDTNEEERKVKETNPCYYCFKTDWLWKELKSLNTENAEKQYYLPDLIKKAIDQGVKIELVNIDIREALGADSKEELAILERLVK